MTPTDREALGHLLLRTASLFNRKLDALTLNAYLDALQDIPLAALETAAVTLQRTQKFWPKPVEWREAAQKTRPMVRRPMPEPVLLSDGSVEPVLFCPRCEDSGWVPDCGCALDALAANHCCALHPFMRHGLRYPNPLQPCDCRDHNPAWQANHQTRYAEAQAPRWRE
jgi:hypothetical protein